MPNVFQHYVRMKQRLTNAWDRNSVPAFTDTTLLDFLGRAYSEIQRKMRIGDVILSGDVTSGTNYYTVPVANASGNRSPRFGNYLRVFALPPTGQGVPSQLIEKPFEWIMANFAVNDSTLNTGFPVFWCWTAVPPLGRIQVFPTPNYSRSSGMQFVFKPIPNEVFGIYNQSTITATFTNGGTSVTFSADPNSTTQNVVGGYEIGVPATTQQDGTETFDDTPKNWVPITDVTGTTATLAWEWPGVSGAGQRFIAAQIPNLDALLPASLDELPSELAASLYMAGLDPAKAPGAPGVTARAQELLAALDSDKASENLGSITKPWLRMPNTTGVTPGYFRNGNAFFYGR